LDQAEFVNAQAAFARSQCLFVTSVISKVEIDVATASFQSAKALYEGSYAALREAKLNLEYTKVYAPASGYVSGVTFGLGTYVQTGKPVFAHSLRHGCISKSLGIALGGIVAALILRIFSSPMADPAPGTNFF
jgi:multidrug efflux pump subunit AcrA (membrane-fusion protein)